jgi:hypothetical protein
MQKFLVTTMVTLVAAAGATGALALDAWDLPPGTDNNANTDNVLWHTAPAQNHDLQAQGGVADQDWFLLYPRARRSYEIQMLNIAEDTNIWNNAPIRYAADTTTVLQTATFLDPGAWIMTMRWIQGATSSNEYLKVTNNSTTVGAGSVYSIQLRETTQYCARYNNASTQISVLIIQRTDPDNGTSCNYEARFNNAAGAEVGSSLGPLGAGNTMAVISTSTVPGVAGTSGSAYIAHSCGIGGINAKMVALEPATGFSFDTPCQARPSN